MSSMTATGRIAGLAYGAVGVSDIDRSLWLLLRRAGLPARRQLAAARQGGPGGSTGLHLAGEGGGIDLLTLGGARHASGWLWDDLQVGMRHIGMKVASVDDWAARLRSVGTHFRVEPLDAFGQVRLAFFEEIPTAPTGGGPRLRPVQQGLRTVLSLRKSGPWEPLRLGPCASTTWQCPPPTSKQRSSSTIRPSGSRCSASCSATTTPGAATSPT